MDPAQQQGLEKIFFGATVTYENHNGEEKTVTLVGIDEADFDEGKISWQSPLARALHKAEEGDIVHVRTPNGRQSIEVVEIRYE